MSYKIYTIPNFNGVILHGDGEHSGTTVNVPMHRLVGNERQLARALDYEFMRANGERIAREMRIDPEGPPPPSEVTL